MNKKELESELNKVLELNTTMNSELDSYETEYKHLTDLYGTAQTENEKLRTAVKEALDTVKGARLIIDHLFGLMVENTYKDHVPYWRLDMNDSDKITTTYTCHQCDEPYPCKKVTELVNGVDTFKQVADFGDEDDDVEGEANAS